MRRLSLTASTEPLPFQAAAEDSLGTDRRTALAGGPQHFSLMYGAKLRPRLVKRFTTTVRRVERPQEPPES